MNRLWDTTKRTMQVLCVSVFFPGVDVNLDSIDQYLGIDKAKDRIQKLRGTIRELRMAK